MNCSFCKRPITDPSRCFRKVMGWERPREQGGTNALALREPLSEVACGTCIRRLKSGIDPTGQMEMA